MSIMSMPRVDVQKLKNEIKTLSELNRSHKKKTLDSRRKLGDQMFSMVRDPDLGWVHKDPAKREPLKVWRESSAEWGRLSYRITQLCALRAFLRGKNHFGPNSTFFKGCDITLEKWVYPVAQEFAVSGM